MENNMNEETQVDQDMQEGADAHIPVDPKEIERQLIAGAQARAEDPIETAGTAYQIYVPHFKAALPKISTRGLRRVLQYLVLYPLEKDSVNAASEFEKQFMQLVNSLVEAKFVMVMASYQQNAQQLYDAEQAALTPAEIEGVTAELRAGGVSEEEITRLTKLHEET